MNPFSPALIAFLIVDAIALLIFLLFQLKKEVKRNKIRHFGDRAEEEVAAYIKENFPSAVLMNNIFLKTARGITQLDHILLCKWGVFVIETKSHNGKINLHSKEWVQIYKDKIVRFHSPLLQNETHCKALETLLRKSSAFRRIPVRGVVVFTSKKVHFSKRHSQVIRLEELSRYIKTGSVHFASACIFTLVK